MSTRALRADLAAQGHDVVVEELGRIAIVTVPDRSLDAAARRRIVSLGRQHGYTNVCMELAPLDANLPGD